MDNTLIFYWLVGGTFILFIGGIYAATWVFLLCRPSLRRFLLLLPLLLLFAVLLSILYHYTVLGGQGPGLYAIGILTVAAAVMPFLAALRLLVAVSRELRRRRVNWRAVVLSILTIAIIIPAALLAPVGGEKIVGVQCDQTDRRVAEGVRRVLEKYRAEKGAYLSSVNALIPRYASALPYSPCAAPRDYIHQMVGIGWKWDIYIERCSRDVVVLYMSTVGGGWAQRLNLANGRWDYMEYSRRACADF